MADAAPIVFLAVMIVLPAVAWFAYRRVIDRWGEQ